MSNFIPRTWKHCGNQEIMNNYTEICNRAIDDGLLDVMPELYLFKSTTKWGECRWNDERIVIGLNEVFCENPPTAINTIVHEIGHAATIGHNHDRYWKEVSNRLGQVYGETVKRGMSESEKGVLLHREEPSYKYTLECPCCHHQWNYQRMSKYVQHPEMGLCGRCMVKLVRVK